MNIKTVLMQGVTVLFVRGFGAILMFSMTLFYARFLGAESFGLFSLGLTSLGVLVLITRFGLDTVLLKNMAVNFETNTELAKSYLSSSLLFVMMWGSLVSILVHINSDFIVNTIFNKPRLEGVLKLFMVGLVPISMIGLFAETFKAIKKPILSSLIQSVIVPMVAIVIATLLYALDLLTLGQSIRVYIVGCLVSLTVALISVEPYLSGSLLQIRCWKNLFRQGWPMLLISSGVLIMSWTDTIVLGIFSNLELVGIYSVASKTVAVTSLLIFAMNSITAPIYAKSFSDKKLVDIANLAQKTTMILLLLAIIPSSFILIFPEWIMGIFGEEFIKGSIFLCILTVGQLVNVACGSVGYLLTMTGNEIKLRNIFLTTALINVVLSIVFLKFFGEVGVAIATSLSMIIWNCWCVLEIKKTLGFWMLRPRTLFKKIYE